MYAYLEFRSLDRLLWFIDTNIYLRGGHCFGLSSMRRITGGKILTLTRLNWATQFLTVAYDGAYSHNVSFRMACISFSALPCRKKNLMTSHILMFLKSRASPDMLPFGLCNKKRLAIRHMNRPLFPETLSIPSYDIGKKVGLRTYQHPFIIISFHNGCYLCLAQCSSCLVISR